MSLFSHTVINLVDICIHPFQSKPWFYSCLQYKSFGNTVGKGEIARNEQFLLFPQCFLHVWRTFYHFHQSLSVRLQTLSVWKSLKLVIWESFNKKTALLLQKGSNFLPYNRNLHLSKGIFR